MCVTRSVTSLKLHLHFINNIYMAQCTIFTFLVTSNALIGASIFRCTIFDMQNAVIAIMSNAIFLIVLNWIVVEEPRYFRELKRYLKNKIYVWNIVIHKIVLTGTPLTRTGSLASRPLIAGISDNFNEKCGF